MEWQIDELKAALEKGYGEDLQFLPGTTEEGFLMLRKGDERWRSACVSVEQWEDDDGSHIFLHWTPEGISGGAAVEIGDLPIWRAQGIADLLITCAFGVKDKDWAAHMKEIIAAMKEEVK